MVPLGCGATYVILYVVYDVEVVCEEIDVFFCNGRACRSAKTMANSSMRKMFGLSGNFPTLLVL